MTHDPHESPPPPSPDDLASASNTLNLALVALGHLRPELEPIEAIRAKTAAFCLRRILHSLVRPAS